MEALVKLGQGEYATHYTPKVPGRRERFIVLARQASTVNRWREVGGFMCRLSAERMAEQRARPGVDEFKVVRLDADEPGAREVLFTVLGREEVVR